jgi:hypothetical protein
VRKQETLYEVIQVGVAVTVAIAAAVDLIASTIFLCFKGHECIAWLA